MDDVKLYMTDAEIVKSYKEAANKRKQVEILCQLNLCKPDDIINVLKKSDIDWRTLPRSSTESSKSKKQYNEIKLPDPKPKFKRAVRAEPKESTDMSEVLSAITKLTDRKRALRAEIEEIDNTLASIVALCQGEQPYGGQNENTIEP